MRNWNFNWQKVLHIFELLGIIITLALLPIDRVPYSHHLSWNLGKLSLVLLLVATVGRLISAGLNRQYDQLRKYFFVGGLLALPVVAYAISSTYAISSSHALGATKLLLAAVLRAFCFFVLVSEKPALWQTIKTTIYVTTSLVVAFGLFQFLADVFGASQKITDLSSCCTSNSTYIFPRVHSTALEPLYFDHYLMIPLWLLSFDFLRNKPARKNKYLLALFILTASLFILTIARSATVGLLIGGAIFYLGLRNQTKINDFWRFISKAWLAAFVLSILLIMLSGLASHFIPKTPINGAKAGVTGSVTLFGDHAISVNDESAKSRYHQWPNFVNYFFERPLLGVGADNSRIRLNLDQFHRGTPPPNLQPFNNDLISLLVDLGLVGVAAFAPLVVLLIVTIYRLFKSAWTAVAAPMALVLIGMLVQGNFFQSLLLTRLWVVVGLLLSVVYSQSQIKSRTTTK